MHEIKAEMEEWVRVVEEEYVRVEEGDWEAFTVDEGFKR